MIPNGKLTELNSLVKSLKLSEENPQDKLFLAITNAINEIWGTLAGHDETFDGMAEVISDVEESVYELENEVFGEDIPGLGDYGDFDDDIYDITCSNCDNTITVDYDAFDEGVVACPGCGEVIEFTIEDD
ncbi:MAG: hypothetical protein FWG70_05020 [Oscillospiraceae bacterium]|nr:hypothetical protein [Oscillospiraceae bacterium]